MIIYKDLISGDELFSDTYPIELLHEAIYKVKGKHTTETTTIDDAAIGGNASAEGGGDEGGDASVVSGVDIVLANRLVSTGMNKKGYKTYIKEYAKAIEATLEKQPDEIPKFRKGCSVFIKELLGDFDNFEFFLGEKMDADGMVCLLRWETPEGATDDNPYMYFFKHGLEAEKV